MPQGVDNAYPSLPFLATMDERSYLKVFAGTAVTRAKRRGLVRNAAIALANSEDERAIPILRTMLSEHDESLARAHAAWGYAQLLGRHARHELQRARMRDDDPLVRDEIDQSLAEVT